MLPTLRSMPPVRMTNVIASEMMPISEICRRMSVRLPGCRKMREPSDADGLISDREQDSRRAPTLCSAADTGCFHEWSSSASTSWRRP